MKPLLVTFVGVPGSGKTEFARQLAVSLNAVVMNSDSMRMALWGSLKSIVATHTDPKERVKNNKMTFGAMDYMAAQIIKAGVNVVYDCNANKVSERANMKKIANDNGGIGIVVRIRTPLETAVARVQHRDETHDQRKLTEEKAREVVERFAREIVEPDETEKTIIISGEIPFTEQLASFKQQLAKYRSLS